MVDELSSIARYVTMFQQRHPRFESEKTRPQSRSVMEAAVDRAGFSVLVSMLFDAV